MAKLSITPGVLMLMRGTVNGVPASVLDFKGTVSMELAKGVSAEIKLSDEMKRFLLSEMTPEVQAAAKLLTSAVEEKLLKRAKELVPTQIAVE